MRNNQHVWFFCGMVAAVLIGGIILLHLVWTPAHSQEVTGSFMLFQVNPDAEGQAQMELQIGTVHNCPLQSDMTDCDLDKVVVVTIGGKVVASVDASDLSPKEQEEFKNILQDTINRHNRPDCPAPVTFGPMIEKKPI